MNRQTLSLENISKKIIKHLVYITLFLLFFFTNVSAKEKWIIDKNLSSIQFELPILFATNVAGEFTNIDGFVEIDLVNKTDNKALLSVEMTSIKGNYPKYRELLLGPIFFDSANYPIGVLDTKKFSYRNETELNLMIELTIKGISKMVNTNLKINKITSDIVQILGKLEFSRTDFKIGINGWANTTILKDKITVNADIFLIRE